MFQSLTSNCVPLSISATALQLQRLDNFSWSWRKSPLAQYRISILSTAERIDRFITPHHLLADTTWCCSWLWFRDRRIWGKRTCLECKSIRQDARRFQTSRRSRTIGSFTYCWCWQYGISLKGAENQPFHMGRLTNNSRQTLPFI